MFISILRFNLSMRYEVREEKGGQGEGIEGVMRVRGWMDGWMLQEGIRLGRGNEERGFQEVDKVGEGRTRMENEEV
jgi:hypothetical protein